MTIAAHIPSNKIYGTLYSALVFLAEKNPEDHFIFFSEEVLPALPYNCTTQIISPKPKNKLLNYYWYRYKLPALLKRYSTDAFISAAGMLSLKTDTDQYLFFDGDIFDHQKKTNNYFKKIFHEGLQKANSIFVSEDIFKTNALQHLPAGEEKIKVVYHAGSKQFVAVDFEEAQLLKETFTQGNEYFFYSVDEYTTNFLITLLKAFSLFKKLQKTSMKLVLALVNIKEEGLINDFKNYKYRSDVIFVAGENKFNELLQQAYAAISFENHAADNTNFKALKNNVPLIINNGLINESVFKVAALYANASVKELSENMMLIYKDEFRRKQLLSAAGELSSKYDAEKTADSIWQTITGK
jgi:hypothetical protein